MHVGKLEAQILDLLALELGHEGRDPVLGHDFPSGLLSCAATAVGPAPAQQSHPRGRNRPLGQSR